MFKLLFYILRFLAYFSVNIGVIMLISTTPNAIGATVTLAISDTLGSAAAIIVGTETFSYPSFSKSLDGRQKQYE